ncbi:MAG: porin [Planctomycetota bacterium]
MKLSKIAMLAAIACASYTSSMTAGANDSIELVSHLAACDCGEPVCGCEDIDDCCDPCGDSCDGGCATGCDSAFGCDSGCSIGSLLGDCCLGDPWSLFGEHCGYSVGGWVQMGYHNNALPLFNSRPDEFQLHQAWVYAEKAIDTSCGFDIGGRIDYVYGTDGPDTQAFGIDNDHWDNDWDNGNDYGHAIPQLYMEAGYGDLSIKAGHFFTIIGWEVVAAPDNFFYSHAYTMYNSEPFTHTGLLATYNLSDDVTAYGGYVLGWDSGFEDNGDSFLGGLSLGLSDDLTLTYATVGGRFADGPAGTIEQGYMHSIVADYAVSDNLQYILQSDVLSSEDTAGTTVRESFGVNQYLIYTLSDCWAAGARFEWYNQEGVFSPVGQDDDIYALTLGVNYRPHANLIVRPEIRWDWDDAQVAGLDEGDDQTTFGIDTIFLF